LDVSKSAQDALGRPEEKIAQLAFERYAVLRKAWAADPALRASGHLASLCDEAYFSFENTYGAC
jgi:hypothetical protein